MSQDDVARITGFQSTLPAREATQIKVQEAEAEQISIHASREGSDFAILLSF